MNIYLADTQLRKAYCVQLQKKLKPYTLESFFYADKQTVEILIPNSKDFMLDSGAFTFMQNNKHTLINWSKYLHDYAQFVKKIKYKTSSNLTLIQLSDMKMLEG